LGPDGVEVDRDKWVHPIVRVGSLMSVRPGQLSSWNAQFTDGVAVAVPI
jgi:hypothetical protein